MTEIEWLSATDPEPMLAYLNTDAGGRKADLFSVACLRRIWHLLPGPNSQSVVALLERRADGERDSSAMDDTRWRAREEGLFEKFNRKRNSTAWAGMAASELSPRFIAESAVEAIAFAAAEMTAGSGDSEIQAQCVLLRDIFGNPFRPVAFAPEWRTADAVALARTMYESREFGAMPILADALQDAGCDNDDILNHCRDSKQVHVRGCWVVDLVLGKE